MTDDDNNRFDGETRGRIKHHAEYDRMGSLLRSIESNVSNRIVENCAEEGIESAQGLVDHYASHGDFTAIDGIGSSTSESLEAALPLLEEVPGIEVPEVVDEESDDDQDQDLRTCTLEEFGVGGEA